METASLRLKAKSQLESLYKLELQRKAFTDPRRSA